MGKYDNVVLINDAVNQIEALFNKTKMNAEIVETSI